MFDQLPPDAIRLALAGLAGSLVSLATSGLSGLKANILRVVSGTLSAIYLGPIFAKMISPFTSSLTEGTAVGISGFVIGLSGMSIVGAIVDTLRAHRNGVVIHREELSPKPPKRRPENPKVTEEGR